jgi:hypothetical protein
MNYDMSALMPQPVKPKRPGWVIPAIVLLAALLLTAGGMVWFILTRSVDALDATLTPSKSRLQDAYETCGSVGELSDGGRTLYLDMAGEDGSGAIGTGVVWCVLSALEVPTYVKREMESTRALDGRRSQSWGSLEASWTYHPDDGLDIIFREIP